MNIGILSNLLKENSINNNKIVGNSLEKLSTGLKINKAADDASGLAISDKLRTQATGIKQSIDNANSAITMMNIADKAMSEMSNILDIIKAKSIQMNTDTTSEEGRKILKTEILKLIDNYDKIVSGSNYNRTPLLNGEASPFNFQVGNNSQDIIKIAVESVESKNMGDIDPNKLKNFITGFSASNPIIIPSQDFVASNSLNYDTTYDMDDFKNYIAPAPVNQVLNSDLQSNMLSIGGTGYVPTTFLGLTDVSVTINSDNFFDNGTSNPYSQFVSGTYFPKDLTTKNYFDALSAFDDAVNGLGSAVVEHFISPTLGDYYKISGANFELVNETSPLILQDKQVLNFSVTSNKNDSNKHIFMVNTIIDSLKSEKLTPEYDSNDIITNFAPDSNLSGITVLYTGKYITTPLPVPDLTPVRNDDNPNLKIQSQILMDVVDLSIDQLNSQRSNVGAGINQLEVSAKNMMTSYVNVKSAESVIRDLDYASESANFNKANIISQAGSFVQSQANNIDKQYVAQLLK